jgi:hypothetical protein
MLNLLQQLNAEVDLPELTENLKRVRLAERCLQGLTTEIKKLRKLLRELENASSPSGSAAPAPRPPPLSASQAPTACSDADQQKSGSDSVSKAESGPRMDHLAASRRMGETVHHIERA